MKFSLTKTLCFGIGSILVTIVGVSMALDDGDLESSCNHEIFIEIPENQALREERFNFLIENGLSSNLYEHYDSQNAAALREDVRAHINRCGVYSNGGHR